jgi:hypothetical protein
MHGIWTNEPSCVEEFSEQFRDAGADAENGLTFEISQGCTSILNSKWEKRHGVGYEINLYTT